MNTQTLTTASNELARSICACMDGLRNANPSLDSMYAACLCASDDFSHLALYADTVSHFQQSGGGMLDKWYFAQWWSQGMDLDASPLIEHLGEVGDIDETPENDCGPMWLAAMTSAMRIANAQNAFSSHKDSPIIFCSLTDSANAVWLENESVRFLNSQEKYDSIASELTIAHNEWYGDNTGRPEYRAAFCGLLAQDGDAR